MNRGPAGGCLPESALDTPVDYDSLAAAGSIMGSGGMIVMDDSTCMVDVARFFLEFTQDESCGKCTPCREGTKRMLEILERITKGRGEPADIDKLLRLADTIRRASLCGLGQAAPNPVISTITHFRHEYEAHVREKKCPRASAPASCCTDRRGEVRGLHRLRPPLPRQVHRRRAEEAAHDRPVPLHQVRTVLPGLQVRRRIEEIT